MAIDMNVWTGTGRLGKDPEVRYMNDGKAVCNMRIAVGGYKDSTIWLGVVVWGKQAEACGEFLAKGMEIAVSGELKCREWNDKEGNKRESWEVDATFGRVKFPPRSTQDTSERQGADDGAPF